MILWHSSRKGLSFQEEVSRSKGDDMTLPVNGPSATIFSAPKQAGKSASKLPLIISLVLLSMSIVLIFLIPISSVTLGVGAYLIAAIGPAGCLAWDAVSQRKGMKSPNFSPNRSLSKFLQFISVAGVIVGTIHVLRISETAAEILTEFFGLA